MGQQFRTENCGRFDAENNAGSGKRLICVHFLGITPWGIHANGAKTRPGYVESTNAIRGETLCCCLI
ncbi:hypothetical protein Pla52n_31120 [Stieleria varia]|uniref:Uncharacterized protein n=1 Tax=Stieleria varia TaxID=2528005 RepID=A0A5C6B1F5_9BACT|nr:hypothetical protein Pla52n_31120 [Stieleria varia]